MKTETCQVCEQKRFNNSPVSYVWWHVHQWGRMCYHCHDIWWKQPKEITNEDN